MGILSTMLLVWIGKKVLGEETFWFVVATVFGALVPPRRIFTRAGAPFVLTVSTLALLAVAFFTGRADLRFALPLGLVHVVAYVVFSVCSKWQGLPLLRDNLYHLAMPWWRRKTGFAHERLAGVSLATLRDSREASAAAMFAAATKELHVETVVMARGASAGGDLAIEIISAPVEDGSALKPLTTRPLIVYIHGGGMVFSSAKDAGLKFALLHPRPTISESCVIASLNYRLAPEHKFPAAADDVLDQLLWLLEAQQAQRFGYDVANVSVMGTSAGGNLAAGLAVRAAKQGIELKSQILLIPMLRYGATTASYRAFGDSVVLGTAKMIWFWEQYVSDAVRDPRDPLCCPGTATAEELAGLAKLRGAAPLAPAIVCTASHDPLRDEGRQYAQTLTEAGVAVSSLELSGSHVGSIAFDVEGRDALQAAIEKVVGL